MEELFANDDIVSKIRNEKEDVSSIMIKNERLTKNTQSLTIYYQSYTGPLALEGFVPKLERKMQNIEAQQEVQNEDASFTNVVAYTTICEAQGCNNRVNNAWSIHRDEGTLEKMYFFCDEHIKIAWDGRGFVLKDRKQ